MARGEPMPQFFAQLGQIVCAPPPVSEQNRALEMLGKTQGDFVQKIEHVHSFDLTKASDEQLLAVIEGKDPASVAVGG